MTDLRDLENPIDRESAKPGVTISIYQRKVQLFELHHHSHALKPSLKSLVFTICLWMLIRWINGKLGNRKHRRWNINSPTVRNSLLKNYAFILYFYLKIHWPGWWGLVFVSSDPARFRFTRSSNILREASLWLLNHAWSHMDCKLKIQPPKQARYAWLSNWNWQRFAGSFISQATCRLGHTNGLYYFYSILCFKWFFACELFFGQFFSD